MSTIINATTTNGVVIQPDNSGSLVLQTNNGTAALTIDTSQRAAFVAGTAALPAITTTGDTNTGIFFPAADTIAFAEGGTESMRIDSSGNVVIGTTSTPTSKFGVAGDGIVSNGGNVGNAGGSIGFAANGVNYNAMSSIKGLLANSSGTEDQGGLGFLTRPVGAAGQSLTERMRIDSSGNVLVGKTSEGASVAGGQIRAIGQGAFTASGDVSLVVNRLTNDGTLVSFQQASTQEGDISVSGTTVSYNGGHLSRWAQTIGAKDEYLVKGTVLSNLDEMNEYVDADGNLVNNEQLNKVKVSDIEGDVNVAGVFVNWTFDKAHNVDEINMAMTGDMIIRIAQDVIVNRGDLLMSAGDGTAKPQGDDIVRNKTIAKVTSNHVTCTYADGSYCVPCVLMAC